MNNLLGSMSPHHYYTRPGNMAFHNLCTTTQPPPGTAALLGLGLKFCIESPRPFQNIDPAMFRLRRDIRIHFYHQQLEADNGPTTTDPTYDTTYIPKLYIKSEWNPHSAPHHAELALERFDRALLSNINNLPWTRRYNLTPSQRHVLSELTKRDDLIILPTDKNLGPCVLERDTYINSVGQEHLLNESNYEFIPADQAKQQLAIQRNKFIACYNIHCDSLSTTAERVYFERAMTSTNLDNTRVPQFYGTPKVHKPGNKTRPVVSCVNSIPEIFSKHVNYQLQKVVTQWLPTALRDSDHLREELAKTFPQGLPPGAKLFSIDAVSMYSNIDTNHGLHVIQQWYETYNQRGLLDSNTPVAFILDALTLIMKDNIFQFGDTTWRQLRGTAMGTSTAVNYANLYVGFLEVEGLITEFQKNLLFYKRFIDDGFGVWVDHPDGHTFAAFMEHFNNWGSLRWTTDGLTNSVVFLDLTISIQSTTRNLSFKTYQKEMNLYLYIPPTSAHPAGVLRSLIFGRLRSYWNQNTYRSDFLNMTKLLVQRLMARGYSKATIMPTFLEAIDRLENGQQNTVVANHATVEHTTEDKQIFFHLPFHPRGIQRNTIRRLFNETLAPTLTDRRLTVAVSRPRNIRDRLSKTVLKDLPGHNPSNLLQHHQTAGTDTTLPANFA